MVSFLQTPLGNYTRRLAELKGQEPRIFRLVLDNNKTKELVIRLNTKEQLETDHTDSKGQALYSKKHNSGVYSKFTEDLNPEKVAGTPYTLKDTGAFFSSFRVEVLEGRICIFANPLKQSDDGGTNLFDEYGEQILGLTSEHIEILQTVALSEFRKWYKANLPQP